MQNFDRNPFSPLGPKILDEYGYFGAQKVRALRKGALKYWQMNLGVGI